MRIKKRSQNQKPILTKISILHSRIWFFNQNYSSNYLTNSWGNSSRIYSTNNNNNCSLSSNQRQGEDLIILIKSSLKTKTRVTKLVLPWTEVISLPFNKLIKVIKRMQATLNKTQHKKTNKISYSNNCSSNNCKDFLWYKDTQGIHKGCFSTHK